MAATQLISYRRRRSIYGTFVLLVFSTGCAAWPAKEVSLEEPWTKSWRSKAETTSGFGFDARSREIERNLGVY